MRRETQRRKLHEALLQTLYPPSLPFEGEEKAETPNASQSGFDLGLRNGVYSSERSSSSRDNSDEGEGETQKLTRAQRKRIRKKKLKEDAGRRGKIIGPLLPPVEQKEAQGVRRNAAVDPVGVNINLVTEEPGNSSKQRRVKQRRMAKKMAKNGSQKETCSCEQDRPLKSA